MAGTWGATRISSMLHWPIATIVLMTVVPQVFAQNLKAAEALSEAKAKCVQKHGPGAVAEEELDFGEVSYVCTCAAPYTFDAAGTRCVQEKASQSTAPAAGNNAESSGSGTSSSDALTDWTRAKYLNTADAYGRFLAAHPNSRFAAQARQKLANPGASADGVFSKAWTKDKAGRKHEAFLLYLKAAEMGHAQAMNNLGVFYHNGQGTKRSYAQAERWYRKAVKQGNAGAMLNLGSMYEYGQSVRRDRPRAAELVARAIKGGSDYALTSMVSNSTQWSREFRRELQRVMREEGFYDGRIDGSFGAGTRSALKRLAGQQ
ncbi:MAG: SEL1-like repeat protein [Alphaproteobacteria bacterium]|nr:SEL1-like repeat protein [Alphaproteobacteria bacterium]